MNEFRDYKSMKGLVNEFPIEKIKSEIERYQKKYRELRPMEYSINKNVNILRSSLDIFKKREKELYNIDLRKNFVLKKEHLIIISKGYDNEMYSEEFYKTLSINLDDLAKAERDSLIDNYYKILDEIPIAIEYVANEKLKEFCKQ